jgi:quercetin dioxygenase-like cupin family protein
MGPEALPLKHTHPGEEIIYVLEGSLEYQVEGQPPMTFNAGDAHIGGSVPRVAALAACRLPPAGRAPAGAAG